MERDGVDLLLEQWSRAPYNLPLLPMAVSKRITRLAWHLEQLAADALEPHGLDPGEFDVLATLRRSGSSHELAPTVLSRSLLISAGGLTKRLSRLEERGLVARRLDPEDRRSLLVALTKPGRVLAEAAVTAHARATARLFDGLSPDDGERLADLLRKLLVSCEQGRGPGGARSEP
jgi:DNA-binding MarR family transcriptional regulator